MNDTNVTEHSNPWHVTCLEDFLYFWCPECDTKHVTKPSFVKHALSQHPKSHQTLSEFGIKREDYLLEDFEDVTFNDNGVTDVTECENGDTNVTHSSEHYDTHVTNLSDHCVKNVKSEHVTINVDIKTEVEDKR